jgi:hypothetical protein
MDHTDLQTLLPLIESRGSDENNEDSNIIRGIARSLSRVLTGDASLLLSDGGTLNATNTQLDLSAGMVMVGGTAALIAALDDQDLVTDLACMELDGTAAARLGDAKQIQVAVVATLVSDVPVLRFIQSAEHATAAVAPTAAQCLAALTAAAETGYDPSGLGVIVARCKLARSGATITTTYYGAAATASCAQERAAGLLV